MEVLTLVLLTLPFGWSMPAEWSSWSPVGSQDGNDASTADSGDVVDDLIDGVPDGGLAAPGDSQDSPGIGLSVPGLGPIGGLGLLGGGAALATIAGIAASTGFAGVGIAKAIHKQTNNLKTKFGFANTNKLKTKFGFDKNSMSGLPLKDEDESFDVLLPGDGLDKMGNAKQTNKLKTKFGFANTNKLKKKLGFAKESISGLLLKDEGKTFNALLKGDGLDKMGKLLSENGEFKLLLEEGGNLVIAFLEGEGKDNFWGKGQDGEHKVLWSTKTAGAGTQFKFQEDGDLVVLDGEKGVIWNSGTGGLGGENLQMTNDGFLTLLGSNGEQIWQSSPPTLITDQNVLENLEIPEMINRVDIQSLLEESPLAMIQEMNYDEMTPEMINRVDIQSLLEESPLAMIQEMNYDEMTSQTENFEDLMSDLREGKQHIASGWSVWSEFAACSATCGPAIKMRERVCIDPANDETMCQGPTAEIFNCDLPICGGWSAWSDVTECSATCGPAVKTRMRTCTDNSNGGLNCLGSSQETVDCDLLDCPELLEDTGNDGAWSAWSDFSACSASCGSATKSRARTCSHLDPINEDQICRGPKEEIADCNLHDCQVTDGEWSTWSDFGRCSATCGPATKRRERTCTGPEPSEEGGRIMCQGPKENVVDCNLNDCPVDGGWSAWSDFSACSATCGPATKRRGRTCSDPEPSNGGILCQGLNEETLNCDLANCDTIDGVWSAWSDFGDCSATCGMATKRRTRSCTEPEPSDGGSLCQGLNEETLNCDLPNCEVDGGWSEWSDFGACSATCGMATKRRTRTCTEPEPSDGGQVCQGLKEEVTHCNFVFC